MDFTKFKKTMMEFKKASGEDKINTEEECKGSAGLDGNCFDELIKEDLNDKSVGWNKKSTMRDAKLDCSYEIYARKMKSSTLYSVYTFTFIKPYGVSMG